MPVPARIPDKIVAALSGGERLTRKELAVATGASLMRVTHYTAAMSVPDGKLDVANGERRDPRGPLPLVFFLREPPAEAQPVEEPPVAPAEVS